MTAAKLRWGNRVATGVARVLTAAVVSFLIAPAILILVLSFSGESVIQFPPESWGLRQYRTLVTSSDWLGSIRLSFLIAIPTALLALFVGLPAVLAFSRAKIPGSSVLQFAGLSSLIIPVSTYAVAAYGLYVELGLLGSTFGLILAHAVLAVPLVLLICGAGITQVPLELEMVAMTLGAPRWRAWLGISVRLLAPALIAAFVFAFLTSFDEAVLVTFLGGPGLITLPKRIFDSVRFGVDAVITAIAAILIVASAVLVSLSLHFQRRGMG